MTRDERIEAAIDAVIAGVPPRSSYQRRGHGITRAEAQDYAEAILAAAYPELAAGTHWIAPREMTKEMVDAAEDRFEDFKDTTQDSYDSYLVISSGYAHGLWSAARDAYLKQEEGE